MDDNASIGVFYYLDVLNWLRQAGTMLNTLWQMIQVFYTLWFNCVYLNNDVVSGLNSIVNYG